MLERRRFALSAAMTALGLIPLATVPLARATEPDMVPNSHRAAPRTHAGRGRPPLRRNSAAAGTTTPGRRASPHEQLELQPGTVRIAAK